MGVKIVKRQKASGAVAFFIDTYHKDFGRFREKTGIEAMPQDRKAFKAAAAAAEDRRRQAEVRLLRDPAAVFSRKDRDAEDFGEYYRRHAEKKGYPIFMNVIPLLQRFTGGGGIPFASMNSGWLERFKSYLLTIESISQNTAGSYLASVKTVIRAAWRAGYIEQDFTGKVAGIRKTSIETEFLTVEQVQVLSGAKCPNEMVKNAFLFSCFTGLRISDILALAWGQIYLIDGAPYLKFRQHKTKQFENVPLSGDAVKVLQAVRGIHAEYAPEGSDKVFILPGRTVIGNTLYVWGTAANLPFRLHFHVSRHTFATMAITAGVEHYTVSKLLGHTDIGTTQRYIRLVDTKRLEAVQALPAVLQSTAALPAASGGDNAVMRALEAKGQKVARALGLQADRSGRFEIEGRSYTAAELAIEVSGGE